MKGEKIYEYTVDVTGMTDYGITLDAIRSGQTPIPPLSADGVAAPRAHEPVADLFENVALTTAAVEYQWVNTRLIWAVGTIEFSTGKIHISGYMQ